jgi:hypothetical protein
MVSQILSRDDLRHSVPSVFATTPWEGMSQSYRFIPTADVLDMMADQGFQVTSARQSRTRIPGKADFTRHMLRLRHASITGTEGEVPEVVLINSHDRSSAYRVFSGVMRFVCENGMIVQSSDFGSFSIRHSGSRDLRSQIMAATSQIMEGVPTIMGRIADWKEIILPRPVQVDFARQAMELKPNPNIPPLWLLTARRDEDMTLPDCSRDLWKTFNCVQEALLRGGQTGRNERGRRVTTRPVKAVGADLRINRRLWELAEAFSRN